MPMSEGPRAPDGAARARGSVVIDAGMRHWYHSCPCCLSAAYPDVKRVLDGEGRAEPGDGNDRPGHSG